MMQKMIYSWLLTTLFVLPGTCVWTMTSEFSKWQLNCEVFVKNVTTFDVFGPEQLVMGDRSGALTLLDMRTGQQARYQLSDVKITALAKVPGVEKVLVALNNGQVILFSLNGFMLQIGQLLTLDKVVHDIKISSDGNYAIFYGDENDFPEIWNLRCCCKSYKFYQKVQAGASIITPDNQYVIVGDDDGCISWYRLFDGKLCYWINLTICFENCFENKKSTHRGAFSDIVHMHFQDNGRELFVASASGKFLKIDSRIPQNFKLLSIKNPNFFAFDLMTVLHWSDKKDFLIGTQSLFFANRIFVLDQNGEVVVSCTTSKSVRLAKALTERLFITLLDNGDLIGVKLFKNSRTDDLAQGFEKLCLDRYGSEFMRRG